jgi:hypothetical protein
MVTSKATQDFVPVKEIRDGIVILKDGSMRAIVLVSSVNFALKSPDEQQAIILQFQNFLNGLDFSVQISAQSRELDIRPYIALLEARYKSETVDLMRIQIREYIQFIKSFIEQSNIMTKTFFVVIPFSPVALNTKNGIFSSFSSAKSGSAADNFQENRTQLEQRIGVVSGGLASCGLKSIQLGTEEIVELFYKTFNPGETEKPIMPEPVKA